MQGRTDEAEIALRKLMVGMDPNEKNYAVLRFNLGWHEIKNGNFKTGIEYLGIGRKLRIWGAYSFPYPQPMLQPGMDVSGKTVLLVGEGGAGDEIINSRFGQTLKARGAKTIFTTNQKLDSLLSRTPAWTKSSLTKTSRQELTIGRQSWICQEFWVSIQKRFLKMRISLRNQATSKNGRTLLSHQRN